MSTEEQVQQDLDTIASGVVRLSDLYTNAAATAFSAALADAKAAWDADNEAKWAEAHTKAQGIIDKLNANQPITPPATAADPQPKPVPSPADAATVQQTVDAASPQPQPGTGDQPQPADKAPSTEA